jgi:hypothetical protein
MVPRAEVLGVGAPAHDIERLKHFHLMAGLLQAISSGQPRRAGADNGNEHVLSFLWIPYWVADHSIYACTIYRTHLSGAINLIIDLIAQLGHLKSGR